MKFKSTNDVKKWLRNLPVVKNELLLKIKFYREISEELLRTDNFEEMLERYRKEIEALSDKLERLTKDTDELFSYLEEHERLIMTARYINVIRWDFIEFKVFYSRRQAIRIHDKAIEKLVGKTVGDVYES